MHERVLDIFEFAISASQGPPKKGVQNNDRPRVFLPHGVFLVQDRFEKLLVIFRPLGKTIISR